MKSLVNTLRLTAAVQARSLARVERRWKKSSRSVRKPVIAKLFSSTKQYVVNVAFLALVVVNAVVSFGRIKVHDVDDHLRDVDDDPSLQNILRLKAVEKPNAEKGDCIAGVTSQFSLRNDRMMRQVMHRISHQQPWGWIRFADGDMNDLRYVAPGEISTSQRLMQAISTWPELDNLVVSVGSWWLCQNKYRDLWSAHMRADVLKNFTFHDQCFYLPMGTPDDDDLEVWEERGIRGWVRMAQESNVPMVLVGPEELRAIPWLSRSDYVNSEAVSTNLNNMNRALRECEEASAKRGNQPVLFVFSAGSGAKTIITELMSAERNTSKDMFVDAGTALDGFAGKASRPFNSGTEFTRKYCNNVLRRDPERIDRWLAPGLCVKEREQERERFKYVKYCRAWRQTGGCDPEGLREESNDAECHESVDSGRSGYCECKRKVGWRPTEDNPADTSADTSGARVEAYKLTGNGTVGVSTCDSREPFTCGSVCKNAWEAAFRWLKEDTKFNNAEEVW